MLPLSRVGLNMGRFVHRGTSTQLFPAKVVLFSMHNVGTFLSVSETRDSKAPRPPRGRPARPPALQKRSRCYQTASTALSCPRAALTTVPVPVTSAKMGLSDFLGWELVERNGPRGLRRRVCALPPRGAAQLRSQLLARALPAAPFPPGARIRRRIEGLEKLR